MFQTTNQSIIHGILETLDFSWWDFAVKTLRIDDNFTGQIFFHYFDAHQSW